jgi:hypothetical protein
MRRGLSVDWNTTSPSWRFGSVAVMINKRNMGLLEDRIEGTGRLFVLIDLNAKGGFRTENLFEALDYISSKEPWVAAYLADPRNTTFIGGVNLLEDS